MQSPDKRCYKHVGLESADMSGFFAKSVPNHIQVELSDVLWI